MLLRAAWWGQQHGAALAWLAAGTVPVFTLGGWHVPEGTLTGTWELADVVPTFRSPQQPALVLGWELLFTWRARALCGFLGIGDHFLP